MITYYKARDEDVVYWVQDSERRVGVWAITVDKKHVYNLYRDCERIPDDIWRQFAKENPDWGNYFKRRRSRR